MGIGNPNHDERGRFSSGPGGGGQSAKRSSDARGKDPATSKKAGLSEFRGRRYTSPAADEAYQAYLKSPEYAAVKARRPGYHKPGY